VGELGYRHSLFQITRWPQKGTRAGEGVFYDAEEFKTRILNGNSPDLSESLHPRDIVCVNCRMAGTNECAFGADHGPKHPNDHCSNWQKVSDENFKYVD